jgi:hypothetical protein
MANSIWHSRLAWPDGAGLAQDQAGLARGVEHPLVHGQHHGAGPLGPGVGAQQGLGLQIADLDARSKMRTSTLEPMPAGRAA